MKLQRVFVIDDDSFLQELVSHQLKKLDVQEVLTFSDPTNCLDSLVNKDQHPQIILLDLIMPNMDGVEFLRLLQEYDFQGGLVLMSGQDKKVLQSVEGLIQTRNINYQGTIEKPFTFEAIKKVIKNFHPTLNSEKKVQVADYDIQKSELIKALGNEELINFYQPKVSFQTGKITGFEALVRWQHPIHGLLYPDSFLKYFEHFSLLNELSQAVIKMASKDYVYFNKISKDMNVAINITRKDLENIRFTDELLANLKENEIVVDKFILEITETSVSDNIISILDNLTRLYMKGVKLAIDDFGTGYSSMSQLQELPFTAMKIDKSFVHQAYQKPGKQAIVINSIKMAKDLGLKIVVEGVEDSKDWNYFKELGCDTAQGYFISKPVPIMNIKDVAISWADKLNNVKNNMDNQVGYCI